ncbi:hypothetical protein [Sulfurimonas sp.]|uniref:Spy/CpxP family protein refolding chaperone n=1 Tax=Sulfurimonas sp. TaxID=2022749 RepID=UPI00260FC625|nr:hypothetical protein [Sulfurimonas sp.]MCW8895231.1 hypothetical protein [Sulfurimonas sp.]
MKLLIILLLLMSPLLADDDEYEYKERRLPLDVSYLNLSEHQYKKLVKIVKKFKHERKEFHEEEEDTTKEISELFLADTFDRDEFVKLTNRLKSLSVEIQADFFAKMHKLLNKKQKKDFIKYMKEWEVE